MSRRTELQASLFCVDCKLRSCDEQALGCVFRLLTKPNYQQKRKALHEAKKAEKRANETGRTKYWREVRGREDKRAYRRSKRAGTSLEGV